MKQKLEEKLYKKLHVKKWKSKMPTYEPENFDLRIHTPEEIAGAMCQAELSHEVIVIFSFLPLLTVPAFGAFWVFLITSVLSAMMDLSFAIMQRYNRPRIMKLCKRRKKNQHDRKIYQWDCWISFFFLQIIDEKISKTVL